MSTFSGIISEIEGVSIDRFYGENLSCRVFLLSHCHTDHMRGLHDLHDALLKDSSHIYVYTSKLSSLILRNMIPSLSEHIKALNINEPQVVKVPSNGSEGSMENFIKITLVPAGHCPGSVMFLLENSNGSRVLYTGDFRFSVESFAQMTHLNERDGSPKIIDAMYFDSTFWDDKYAYFPSREDSCDVICNIIKKWIRKGKNHVIVLDTPARFGSEYLYMEIYKRLKVPVHVNDDVYKTYSCIMEMDNTITTNSDETQIHSCGAPDRHSNSLRCRFEKGALRLRTVRISAMMWSGLSSSERCLHKKDVKLNKYYVCYSSHCSQTELKEFISYLKPKRLEPCVVPKHDASAFRSSIDRFFQSYSKRDPKAGPQKLCSFETKISGSVEMEDKKCRLGRFMGLDETDNNKKSVFYLRKFYCDI